MRHQSTIASLDDGGPSEKDRRRRMQTNRRMADWVETRPGSDSSREFATQRLVECLVQKNIGNTVETRLCCRPTSEVVKCSHDFDSYDCK